MEHATIACCCDPPLECAACEDGTSPPNFQVGIEGVTGGFSPTCCISPGALNDIFTLDFLGNGVFDGLPACYWILNLAACAAGATDYIRVVLYRLIAAPYPTLRVQVYAASAACPVAPQPLFNEARELTNQDCSEIDEEFAYTRPPISGDTAVADFKSATVHVLALP